MVNNHHGASHRHCILHAYLVHLHFERFLFHDFIHLHLNVDVPSFTDLVVKREKDTTFENAFYG